MTTAPVVAPGEGTAIVVDRLHRPYDPARLVAALLGLPRRAAVQLVGSAIAASSEADALLDAMPQIVRSMAIATTDRPERCHGELRGPILWSETMSARSASAGDPGLFVCATTTKAYDTAENRVLKAAISAIARAGHSATQGRSLHDDEALRHVRHNELRARHLLEHRTLSGVPLGRVTGRMLQRTSAGSRRATYRPALAMLHRAHDPLTAPQLRAQAPAAILADHDLLASALLRADATGVGSPLLNDVEGITAGPIRYDHLVGVTIDGVPVHTDDEIDAALAAASAPA